MVQWYYEIELGQMLRRIGELLVLQHIPGLLERITRAAANTRRGVTPLQCHLHSLCIDLAKVDFLLKVGAHIDLVDEIFCLVHIPAETAVQLLTVLLFPYRFIGAYRFGPEAGIFEASKPAEVGLVHVGRSIGLSIDRFERGFCEGSAD